MTRRLAPGEGVFVTGMFDAEPIFHSWRRWPGGGLSNDATDCGLDRSPKRRIRLVSMPKVHAERFARPCCRCWRSP